ncbi:hypothetical protein [Demequina sp.]|uniref:hypothetical protein n=1 Tax=Demequina sp. TaxID=2050685 RepID=UPI003A864D1B
MSVPLGERSRSRRLRASLPPVEPVPSAKRTFRLMVDQQIVPVLSGWGLVGDGDRFHYPSEVWHLGLGFAPLSWGTVGALRFDVHVLAVPREAWRQWRETEPALPVSPDPAVYCAQDVHAVGGLSARLRELDGGSADRRFAVHASEDPSATAAEVLSMIERRVLPAFAGRSEVPRLAS